MRQRPNILRTSRSLLSKTLRRIRRTGNSTPPPAMLRPFTRADLSKIPDGWEIRPPDFIGIGFGGSGTTWWYQMLLQHHHVYPNRVGTKELAYFPHFGSCPIDREAADTYRQAFAAPPGGICGEWTPGYAAFPCALDRLKETAPLAKLLLIVRNPIDRFLSAYNRMNSIRLRYLGINQPHQAYFVTRWYNFPQALFMSKMADPIRRLLELFDRDQLLVQQYEKLRQSPESEIARTYRFLGVDANLVPEALHRPVNRRPHRIALSQEERKQLVDYFAEDVSEAIRTFPEIDACLWPDFHELISRQTTSSSKQSGG